MESSVKPVLEQILVQFNLLMKNVTVTQGNLYHNCRMCCWCSFSCGCLSLQIFSATFAADGVNHILSPSFFAHWPSHCSIQELCHPWLAPWPPHFQQTGLTLANDRSVLLVFLQNRPQGANTIALKILLLITKEQSSADLDVTRRIEGISPSDAVSHEDFVPSKIFISDFYIGCWPCSFKLMARTQSRK